jgi:hypothetical protein
MKSGLIVSADSHDLRIHARKLSMISKPQTQFSLLIGSLCCAMFVGAVEAAAAERPNIILLMADDKCDTTLW